MQKKYNPSEFYLKSGDLVDIVAPGSACPEDLLNAGVKWLEKNNLKARFDKNILNPQLYLSNTDEFRFKDLKKALLAKDSKAVWSLRGGYGTFRLWPELLKIKRPHKPKLFIGISDVTSVHQLLAQKWKWPSLHGPLFDRVGAGKLSSAQDAELLKLIFGLQNESIFNRLKPLNDKAKNLKKLKGKVLGGNLCTYTVSLGTSLHPKFKASESIILFFEDIGERGYKVDRFLQHLTQAKVFENVKAIVFGDFVGGGESDGKNLIEETLFNFAQNIKKPVFSGLPAGHSERQRAVFFNTMATLVGQKSCELKIHSPYSI